MKASRMLKKVLLFLLTLQTPVYSSIDTLSSQNIIETNTLDPILEVIKNADPDTLVIFDVDDVLVYATDQLLQFRHKPELNRIIVHLSETHSKAELEDLMSTAILQHNMSLVTAEIFKIFEVLKGKSISYVALTAAQTGPLGHIESQEDWRINHLKSLGFDFEKPFSQLGSFTFSELPSKKDPRRVASFKDGVLFCCDVPKGVVLQAFLKKAKLKFKRIIFIDDLMKNHDSVADYCTKNNIIFLGFHYTGAHEKHDKSPFNRKRSQLQIDTLVQERKWLSDAEADRILKMNAAYKPRL